MIQGILQKDIQIPTSKSFNHKFIRAWNIGKTSNIAAIMIDVLYWCKNDTKIVSYVGQIWLFHFLEDDNFCIFYVSPCINTLMTKNLSFVGQIYLTISLFGRRQLLHLLRSTLYLNRNTRIEVIRIFAKLKAKGGGGGLQNYDILSLRSL